MAITTPITDLKTHPKPFVGIEALASYLDISPRTIYHHINKGTLKAVKVGGLLKIPVAEALRFASVPARAEATG